MNKPKINKTPVQLLLSMTKQANETPNSKRRIWDNGGNEDEQEIHR